MYEAFKNVISGGNYELADIKSRIAIAWAGGEITTEQRAELDRMAEENARPENSYAPIQQRLDEAFRQIADLSARVSKLEGNGESGPAEEYPPYAQPTGAHDAYHAGDKMTYTDGVRYECVAPDGVAVVWGPDVMPSYWRAVD